MTKSAGSTRCRSKPITTFSRLTSWRSTRTTKSSRFRSPSRRRDGDAHPMTVAAVIVAAGRGVRMGAGRPKAFVRVGGETILERSVRAFASHPRIGRIVVAVADPPEAAHALGRLAARVVLVRGGDERQESVQAALGAIREDEADIVLVHDAARPLVGRDLVDAVIEAAGTGRAAVPATAIPSTVKRVAPDRRRDTRRSAPPAHRLRRGRAPASTRAPPRPGRSRDPAPARPGRAL